MAMPGYKGHLVGAAAANVVYVGVLKSVHQQWLERNAGLLSDWQMLVGLFVIALLFGLWPDVDTNSKGQNVFLASPLLPISYLLRVAVLKLRPIWDCLL